MSACDSQTNSLNFYGMLGVLGSLYGPGEACVRERLLIMARGTAGDGVGRFFLMA